MTRIRTHKTSKFFHVSNSTAQDCNLTFESLGLLTYCLSMPETWDFKPQVIWKQRKISRNKVYKAFNELIENHHCVRIINKTKNLSQDVEYEIFDDKDDCKERIKELKKNKSIYLEYSGSLKKCFRHSNPGDAEGWNDNKETKFLYASQDDVPPHQDLKNTTTIEEKKEVVVVSFEGLKISDSKKKSILKKFPKREEIELAIQRTLKTPSRDSDEAVLFHWLNKPDQWNETQSKEDILKENNEHLQSLNYLDGERLANSRITVGTTYIEFCAGSKTDVFDIREKDFISKTDKMIDFLKKLKINK